MKLHCFFAWYDLWIGFYIDVEGRSLYVCPLPCVVIQIKWGKSERELYLEQLGRVADRREAIEKARQAEGLKSLFCDCGGFLRPDGTCCSCEKQKVKK